MTGEKRKRSYKSKVKLDDEYVLRHFHARIIGQKSGPSMQYVEQAGIPMPIAALSGQRSNANCVKELTARAAASAIAVFGDNLYHLLMQAP